MSVFIGSSCGGRRNIWVGSVQGGGTCGRSDESEEQRPRGEDVATDKEDCGEEEEDSYGGCEKMIQRAQGRSRNRSGSVLVPSQAITRVRRAQSHYHRRSRRGHNVYAIYYYHQANDDDDVGRIEF
jgi:hypothetical protein